MKGDMADRFRRRFALGEDDQNVLVPDPDTALIFEFLAQSQYPHEPFGARARIADGQSKMPHCAEGEWNLHDRDLLVKKRDASYYPARLSCVKQRQPRNAALPASRDLTASVCAPGL